MNVSATNQNQVANRELVKTIKPQNTLFVIGLLFVLFYIAQYYFSLRFNALNNLQSDYDFKLLTGIGLAVYIFSQWRLYRVRENQSKISQRRIIQIHQWLGVLSPVVLYIHTAQIGYGYQLVMTYCFLLTVLSGIMSPSFLGYRNRLFYKLWLITHVLFAFLFFLLIFYHLLIVFTY